MHFDKFSKVKFIAETYLFNFRIVVRTVQMTVFPDEIMLAQQREKADKSKQELQQPIPTEQRNADGNRKRNASGGTTPDSGYHNRGLDLRHDNISNHTEESSIPEVQIKNGKIRQRQLSNQRVNENMAETTT